MKFAHLAEQYKETFEKLNDGKRGGNQAMNQDAALADRPAWGRNEFTGYQQYAESRIYSGKEHDAAMADVEKIVIWRGEMPQTTRRPMTEAEEAMLQN